MSEHLIEESLMKRLAIVHRVCTDDSPDSGSVATSAGCTPTLSTVVRRTPHDPVDSGHVIQDSSPDLVTAAITEVVEAVRSGEQLTPCDDWFEDLGGICA